MTQGDEPIEITVIFFVYISIFQLHAGVKFISLYISAGVGEGAVVFCLLDSAVQRLEGCKPSLVYICELHNGAHITLGKAAVNTFKLDECKSMLH